MHVRMRDQTSRPNRDFYVLAVAMVLIPAIAATVLAAFDSLAAAVVGLAAAISAFWLASALRRGRFRQ